MQQKVEGCLLNECVCVLVDSLCTSVHKCVWLCVWKVSYQQAIIHYTHAKALTAIGVWVCACLSVCVVCACLANCWCDLSDLLWVFFGSFIYIYFFFWVVYVWFGGFLCKSAKCSILSGAYVAKWLREKEQRQRCEHVCVCVHVWLCWQLAEVSAGTLGRLGWACQAAALCSVDSIITHIWRLKGFAQNVGRTLLNNARFTFILACSLWDAL